MWSPDSSITGATEAAFTTPTYTLSADLQPLLNSRQYLVTAIGGTQTDVRANSAGDPFSVTLRRQPYKALPTKNPVTGQYGNVPLNKVDWLYRKGLKIDSAGTIRVGNVRISVELPAGSETNDPKNVRALMCFAHGLVAEEAQDIADSLIAGAW